jgi:hypothetical protein
MPKQTMREIIKRVYYQGYQDGQMSKGIVYLPNGFDTACRMITELGLVPSCDDFPLVFDNALSDLKRLILECVGVDVKYVRLYLRGSNKAIKNAYYDGLEKGCNDTKAEIRKKVEGL